MSIPTLLDVAKRACVSKATASMAMRGDARVALETRQRVRKAARELDYRPDPMLSALSRRRHDRKPHCGLANLACILDDRWEPDFMILPHYRASFEMMTSGMKMACEEMGYSLSILRVHGDLLSHRNPNRYLTNLGIGGIILMPFWKEDLSLPIDFRTLSVISVGGYHGGFSTHCITLNFFASIDLVCRKLCNAGYRRIVLAHRLHAEDRQRHKWIGAWERDRLLKRHKATLLPPWLPEHLVKQDVRSWIERDHPDAVITNDLELYNALLSSGIKVPEDLGVAFLNSEHCGVSNASGIDEHLDMLGKTAVEQLHLLLLRGERGETATPLEILIHPTWMDGQTIRNP